MFEVNFQEEFLAEIRGLDPKLVNARITSIEINKKERRIKYVFICENVIGEDIEKKVWVIAKKRTPAVFERVNVYFNKIVCNDELINNEIYKYVKANYPSVSIFLKQTDIRSKVYDNMVKYVIKKQIIILFFTLNFIYRSVFPCLL